ncbi:MAG TPA: hypothetical protein ENI59_01295 [Euryarchaeota archaeon]|nr:hypothetical protein [Euryarchaeota archaeon]
MEIYDIKIPKEKLIEIIRNRIKIKNIDVEHTVSILDDQLSSIKEKIDYAIEKLEENDPDEIKLVIKENEAILIVKIENTIDIRITSEDVVETKRIFENYLES